VSATKKRGYSREFTPKTARRVMLAIDRVPPTLMREVQARARREGTSVRALVLTLLAAWVDRPADPVALPLYDAAPPAEGGAR
jgi:hypothetical protein